jgi:hypothetical protein
VSALHYFLAHRHHQTPASNRSVALVSPAVEASSEKLHELAQLEQKLSHDLESLRDSVFNDRCVLCTAFLLVCCVGSKSRHTRIELTPHEHSMKLSRLEAWLRAPSNAGPSAEAVFAIDEVSLCGGGGGGDGV